MNKLILFFTIAIIISISGCGDKNETTGDNKNEANKENKKETAAESPDVKDDSKKDETTQSESTGDKNTLNELGMTPGLPANYPADIPQPLNSKTLGSLNTSEGTIVTFESSDKVLDIVNYYKEEMKKNGYVISEEGETLVSDKGGLINFKKEDKTVGLMLGFDKDKDITSLVITYK